MFLNQSFALIITRFETPNELRIDAAGCNKANEKGQGAAASVRVGLSRIWKMKPDRSGKNVLETQYPTIKERSAAYFTWETKPCASDLEWNNRQKVFKGNEKRTVAKAATAREEWREMKPAYQGERHSWGARFLWKIIGNPQARQRIFEGIS